MKTLEKNLICEEEPKTLVNTPIIDVSGIENPIVKHIIDRYNAHSQQAISYNRSANYSKGSHSRHSKGGSPGPCYLTTTCIMAKGLSDNCLELTILRRFRDKVLLPTPEGRKAVKEYYRVAPEIVQAIEEQEDVQNIWQATYRDIRHAISLILSRDFEGAFKHYKQMTSKLKDKYIS